MQPRFAGAPRSRGAWLLAGSLLAALLLAACAQAASPPAPTAQPTQPASAAQRIEVTLSEFKIEPATLSARAGDVTFVVENVGAIEHNFIIEGPGSQTIGRIPVIAPGKTEELKVTLTPGTYRVVCTLPGHGEAGMVGTLTVAGG